MTIRIAHVSDIHFGGELAAAAEAALQAVDGLDPTFIAVTGDLTLNGLPREFRAARDWLARLRQPLLVTPGNHDTPYWNLPLRALRPFDRYRRYIGPADSHRLRRRRRLGAVAEQRPRSAAASQLVEGRRGAGQAGADRMGRRRPHLRLSPSAGGHRRRARHRRRAARRAGGRAAGRRRRRAGADGPRPRAIRPAAHPGQPGLLRRRAPARCRSARAARRPASPSSP